MQVTKSFLFLSCSMKGWATWHLLSLWLVSCVPIILLINSYLMLSHCSGNDDGPSRWFLLPSNLEYHWENGLSYRISKAGLPALYWDNHIDGYWV
jgi:hypothetical protein